jgi:RimJ/RimL family protein N-acetyltransferase
VIELIGDRPDDVGAWVSARQPRPVPYVAGSSQAIGFARCSNLIAGVLYYQYNGPNIWMAVAADPKSRWLTKRGVQAIFDYPFRQLGCRRITVCVDEDNHASRNFVEGLGLEQEALLTGACSAGDQIIYRMFRDKCRWLSLESKRERQKAPEGARPDWSGANPG